MGPADDVEGAAKASPLYAKYGTRAEAESAREKLAARTEKQDEAGAAEPKAPRRRQPAPKRGGAATLTDFLTSREGKALQKKVMRGVFGMLKTRL